MNTHDFFIKVRSATPMVLVPETLKGLSEAADLAYQYEKQFSHFFWNTPERSLLQSDADYIALVISILKKRCGIKGSKCALDIITKLENSNAD